MLTKVYLILAMLYLSNKFSQGKTLGLKENLDAVKKELSTEEQFLTGVIKAEGFFKKYKNLLIALVAIIFITFLVISLYKSKLQRSLTASNEAFVTLLENPTDKEALELLKTKNSKLYQLFLFSQETKTNDLEKLKSLDSQITEPILKDLLRYQEASLSSEGLSGYAMKQGAILKEFAKLQEAYLLFEAGKNKEAQDILKQISYDSPLNQVAESLKHYLK